MHAILATIGTDGDVFPYVGLGARLRGRGHRVTLAGPETYQGLAAQHGLSFHCLVSQAEADEFLANPDIWRPLKSGLRDLNWLGNPAAVLRAVVRRISIVIEPIFAVRLGVDDNQRVPNNVSLFRRRTSCPLDCPLPWWHTKADRV